MDTHQGLWAAASLMCLSFGCTGANPDARISVITNDVLSPRYRFANSVMQPRMLGVGAQVRW